MGAHSVELVCGLEGLLEGLGSRPDFDRGHVVGRAGGGWESVGVGVELPKNVGEAFGGEEIFRIKRNLSREARFSSYTAKSR